VADVAAAAFLRNDKTARKLLEGRAGKMVQVRTAESGALEDWTSGETSLDRELAQISTQSQVDDELAKLKGELAAGGAKKELEQ